MRTKQTPAQVHDLSGQHKLEPNGVRVGTRAVNHIVMRRHSAARGTKKELMCHYYTANPPNHKFSILESEKQKRRRYIPTVCSMLAETKKELPHSRGMCNRDRMLDPDCMLH
jgi:hypothetical protein